MLSLLPNVGNKRCNPIYPFSLSANVNLLVELLSRINEVPPTIEGRITACAVLCTLHVFLVRKFPALSHSCLLRIT